MKTLSFPCWASSGKCDCTDWEWEFDISDDEFIQLKKAADTGASFRNCPEVSDLYSRLYYEMLREQAKVYLDNNDLLQEVVEGLELENGTQVSEEQVVDYLNEFYTWGISFPEWP